MAKWSGQIGYAPSYEETAPGVWCEKIVIKNYYGEVMRNIRHTESSGQINDDINVNNRIRIIADPYARENFHMMRWITFMGTKWKISDVEEQYPGLVLSIGGLYHGDNETED